MENETMIDPQFSVDVEEILNQLSGGDIDIYGCIASAGFVFCEALNMCIRSWETDCPISTPPH